MEIVNIIIQSLIAIGTIAVAIIAIWGDTFRNKLYAPKPKIVPHNLSGNLTSYTNGKKLWFYHLKVINKRIGFPLKNCRVLLKAVYKIQPGSSPIKQTLPVPQQFIWSPAGLEPMQISINKEHIFDFGKIVENAQRWEPEFYSVANDYSGYVYANDTLRFCLQVDAQGYNASKYQVFEVTWNGEWSNDPEIMKNNLIITEIKEDQIS